jgi:hypothetical protein
MIRILPSGNCQANLKIIKKLEIRAGIFWDLKFREFSLRHELFLPAISPVGKRSGGADEWTDPALSVEEGELRV